jgi:hypothetical protein
LTIRYETYRDKVLPGSEEKWKIKISGDKKEKLTAEILGSMYDASLDQFKKHSWSVPGIFPSFSGYIRWVGEVSFSKKESQEKFVIGEDLNHLLKPTTI